MSTPTVVGNIADPYVEHHSGAYSLPVRGERSRALARGWLMLGLAALMASGVFAILLVMSRTPHVQDVIPWVDFFHTALVVHVDLSVLIWFLAFGGVLWTLSADAPETGRWPWRSIALALATAGTAVVAVAPFAGAGNPLMNNYVPVLQHPLFFAGLVLFGLGVVVQVSGDLLRPMPLFGDDEHVDALRIGTYTGLVASAMAAVALVWSYLAMPDYVEGHPYYEHLFWGGGHVLQFAYGQLMLVAWLWLAAATGARPPLAPRLAAAFLIVGLAPVLVTPVIYLANDLLTTGHRAGFTKLMEYGGGIAPALIGIPVLAGLVKGRPTRIQRPAHSALISSLVLFAVGGILGFLITGVNTVIPAHYHGSIVGVTLAFMGLTFVLLPKLGFRAPEGRLASSQPYVYGAGQLVHIGGLAWSGALGIQRKTAGTAQGLRELPEIAAMGMMGLGGLISVIGGLLFLVVAIRAMWPRKGG